MPCQMMKSTLAQAAIVALMACAPGLSLAQQSPPADAAPPLTVNLPAQPLRSALEALAKQAGVQMVYPAKPDGLDKTAPAVQGQYALDDALQRLLHNSGLTYTFAQNGGVAIVPLGTGEAADRAVTIVGSRLKGGDKATPVTVLDAEALERGGYSSVEDVFRRLPQSFSGIGSVSKDMEQGEFGRTFAVNSRLGASTVNLRGLGSRSTLILINGRRKAASAQDAGGFTDISSIPLAQIERIEILADGASAIYGADAVAGVVNIVLKDHYEATTVRARLEHSSTGGHQASTSIGNTLSWGSGSLTSNASLSYELPANTNLLVHSGPMGRGDFTDLGGVNRRTLGVGAPGVLYAAKQEFGALQPGDPTHLIPSGQNGSNLTLDQMKPYTAGMALPSEYANIRLGAKRRALALRLQAKQNLTDDLVLHGTLDVSRQTNASRYHPSRRDFNIFAGTNQLLEFPDTNVYNKLGETRFVGYSFENEFKLIQFSEQEWQNNTGGSVGLTGKMPFLSGWDFELYLSHSRERMNSNALGGWAHMRGSNASPLAKEVLNNLNPLSDGQDAAVVQANAALLSKLVDTLNTGGRAKSTTLDGQMRGSLGELWAGPIQLATGFQFRRENYDLTIQTVSTASNARSQTAAFFGEMNLPLLKDQPFAKELSLTLAARHERFNLMGDSRLTNSAFTYAGGNEVSLVTLGGFTPADLQAMTGLTPGKDSYGANGPVLPLQRRFANTSPALRLAWKPVDELVLRATWGRSFLTPSLQQMFGFVSMDDGGFYLNDYPGKFPTGVNNIISVTGSNSQLKPQQSTTMTAGFDWTPSFEALEGMKVSATYSKTVFKNYIGDPMEGGTSIAEYLSNLSLLPPGTYQVKNGVMLWDRRSMNFAERVSESLDLKLSQYVSTDMGDFDFTFDATRSLRLTSQLAPWAKVVDFNDSDVGPSKWRASSSISYLVSDYTFTLAAAYSSAHRVLRPLALDMIYAGKPNPALKYRSPSITTFDFQFAWRPQEASDWTNGLQVMAGVQNIFNRKPAFVDNEFGFLANRYNPRGRLFYLEVSKAF